MDARAANPLVSIVSPVPGSTYEIRLYVVGKGDTFNSIAERFQITTSDLRVLNPTVMSHRLLIGMRLRVRERPAEQPSRPPNQPSGGNSP